MFLLFGKRRVLEHLLLIFVGFPQVTPCRDSFNIGSLDTGHPSHIDADRGICPLEGCQPGMAWTGGG